MGSSKCRIRRAQSGGFELINWSDNVAQAVGTFLITDAPNNLEKLEAFLSSDQQELLFSTCTLQKKGNKVTLKSVDDPFALALLDLGRFVGIVQEWLFFANNDAPSVTIQLATPEKPKDIDPNMVHVTFGEYGGKVVIATRFPMAWTPEILKQKIEEALQRVVAEDNGKVIAITKDGIVIQMYMKNDQVVAAFPSKLYNVK